MATMTQCAAHSGLDARIDGIREQLRAQDRQLSAIRRWLLYLTFALLGAAGVTGAERAGALALSPAPSAVGSLAQDAP